MLRMWLQQLSLGGLYLHIYSLTFVGRSLSRTTRCTLERGLVYKIIVCSSTIYHSYHHRIASQSLLLC
mgnify:CR=1 FL=1